MVNVRVMAQQVGISESDKIREILFSMRAEFSEIRSSISEKLGAKSRSYAREQQKSVDIEKVVDEAFKKHAKGNKSVEEITANLVDEFNKKRQKDKDDLKVDIASHMAVFSQKYSSSLTSGLRNVGADIVGSLKANSNSSSRNNYEELATASSTKAITSTYNGLLGSMQKLLIPDKLSKSNDNGRDNPNHPTKSNNYSRDLSINTKDREQLVKALSIIKEHNRGNKEKSVIIDGVIEQLGTNNKNPAEENKIKDKTIKELSEKKQQEYYDNKNAEKDKVLTNIVANISIAREKYTKSVFGGLRNLASDGLGMFQANSPSSVRNNYEEAAAESHNKAITNAYTGTVNLGQKVLQTRYQTGQDKDNGQDNPNHLKYIVENGNEPIKKSIVKLDKYVRNDLIDDIIEELEKLNKKRRMENDVDGSLSSNRSYSSGLSSESEDGDDNERDGSGFGISDIYGMVRNFMGGGIRKGISNIWRKAKLGLRGSRLGRSALGRAAGRGIRGLRGGGSMLRGAGSLLGGAGKLAGKVLPFANIAMAGYGAYSTAFDQDARTKEASRLSQMGVGGRVADTLGLGNVSENFKGGVLSGVGKTALDVLSAPIQMGKNIGTGVGTISDIIGSKNEKKNIEKASDDRIANMNDDGYNDSVQRLKKPLPNGKQITDDIAKAAAVSQSLRTMSIGPAMSVSQTNSNLSIFGNNITKTLADASSDLAVDPLTGKIDVGKANVAMKKLKSVSKNWEFIRNSIKNGLEPGVRIDEKILSKGDDMYVKLLPERLKILEEYITNIDKKNPEIDKLLEQNTQETSSSTILKSDNERITNNLKPQQGTNTDMSAQAGMEEQRKKIDQSAARSASDALKDNIGKIDAATQPAISKVGSDIKDAVTTQNKNISDQLAMLSKQMIVLTDKKPVMIPPSSQSNPNVGFGYISMVNQGA